MLYGPSMEHSRDGIEFRKHHRRRSSPKRRAPSLGRRPSIDAPHTTLPTQSTWRRAPPSEQTQADDLPGTFPKITRPTDGAPVASGPKPRKNHGRSTNPNRARKPREPKVNFSDPYNGRAEPRRPVARQTP